MRLINAEVVDFKSIIKEKIEVKSNLLCFVGKNECGKSSIIQALSYLNLFDTDLKPNMLNKNSMSFPKGLPVVIGVFQVSGRSYNKLFQLLSEHLDVSAFGLPTNSDKSFLQIKRWGNGISNASIILTDNESYAINISEHIDLKAKFYSDFFEHIYPVIEYYEKEDLLIEPATVEELLGNDKKFETFRRLLFIGGCQDISSLNNPDDNFISTYHSQIEDRFNDIFKKHYKQDNSISIRIQTIRGNKLSLIIKDRTKLSFSIDERSPGFKYYFSFLVNKLYSKLVNGEKNSILLLDEPGNNLHPNGAKDLLSSFNEIAEKSQIFYTTHNPFLVVRNCLDSLFFVAKSTENGTKINRKPFLNKYQILRKELGILLNDSFLIGDINLVVEGNTEKLALHRLFQIEKYKELEWLNIYDAGGVTNIPPAINYLGKNNLKLSGIVILDSDKEAEDVKKNKGYKENIKESNWGAIEINDVFKDKKERTFEDLFPQKLYVDAYNEYCRSLKNLEILDNFNDFKYESHIEEPIINTIDIHFRSYIKPGSKTTITKQDIMRQLLDNIDKLQPVEQGEALSNIYKLLEKISTENKRIEMYVSN